MKKISVFLTLVFTGFALMALAACGPQETTLTGDAQTAVLAFSEPATDNLFAGVAANDYAMYSKDFDADMLKAVPATTFTTWKQELEAKIGPYVSREVAQVTQQGDFYVVRYTAKFAQEDNVTVRVVFRVAEPHAISGLWFDSEKLRQK